MGYEGRMSALGVNMAVGIRVDEVMGAVEAITTRSTAFHGRATKIE